MKTKSVLASKCSENQMSPIGANHLSRTWKGLLQSGLLLCAALQCAPQARAQTFSIWNDATLPTNPSFSDPNSVEVGLKFRSSVDGFITGIRFYKGAANTGTHVGSLWSSTGTLLGSVTFGSETASGWQEQDLPVGVAISSNTTYVVSYHAPSGGYALDSLYFATSGFDNPPLRALADNEDGHNGLFIYSATSAFPTNSFNSANYWVDVVLTVPVVQDTNPPAITCPPDILLQCADCDTSTNNTGAATATDESSFTISYNDSVSGYCPKVTKRTWTATDFFGNTSHCVQTITCLPSSLVTESDGCIFDRDPSTSIQDFRLLFIQDPQNWPCYRLVANNPGQFMYNVFFTGTAGQQVTFNLTVPYPFVTQGANPIQGYDWVNVTSADGQQCLDPGNNFFVSSQQVSLSSYGKVPAASVTVPVTLTVPPSGAVYLTMHLAYGLKGTTGYTSDLSGDAVSCANTAKILVPNNAIYNFSVGGAQNGGTSIQSENSFKKIPGIAGLVLNTILDPVPGTKVTLKGPSGLVVGTGVTDDDGFYFIAYKATGKTANYLVSVTTPPPVYSTTTQVPLKANSFYRVDFSVP
jgi:hypothetical protein